MSEKQNGHRIGGLADADLRLLRVFQAVVRCGGVTAAEPELNIGRSAISRYLKALEIRLGTTLCLRGRGGFSLTGEGIRVSEAATRLLAAVERFRTEAEDVSGNLRGTLRVCLFDKTVTNHNAHIADALSDFTKRAPDVSVELHMQPTQKTKTGVTDGAWEIGIIPTYRKSVAFDYVPLFSETMYLYCAQRHKLFAQHDTPDKIRQVWEQRYAGLSFYSANLSNGNRYGFERSAVASDQEAIAILILSGQYIGFLPDHYAASLQSGYAIRALYPEKFHYRCDFAAITRSSPSPSRIVKLALACLRRAHSRQAAR